MRCTRCLMVLLSFTLLTSASRAGGGALAEVQAATRAGKGIAVLAGDLGASAASLAKASQWTFFVQMPKAQADKLRRELDAAGLLGSRVWVQDGVAALYLADDLADVVAVPDDRTVPGAEILRVLRPEERPSSEPGF